MKDKGNNRAKSRIIRAFIIVLILALLVISVGAYFIYESKTTGVVDDSKVTYTKICVIFGLFLIFMDFFFTLPKLTKKDPFADEAEMRKKFEKHIPESESLVAGVYAKATESLTNLKYRKCGIKGNSLVKDENHEFIFMERRKYTEYLIYIGITQTKLLIVECDRYKHYYAIHETLDCPLDSVPVLEEEIDLNDVGVKYDIREIAKFEVKNGKQGSKNAVLTMKDGSYYKITIPDNAGPNAKMPKHDENSKKLLDTLKTIS